MKWRTSSSFPVSWPGFYDAAFLALPEEVLSTTLVHHQHYFPVVSDRGELKEAFLAVVNTQPKDERLIAKNAERVVAARLRDARFFWESDRKTPLESRLERLHTVLFHKKLGSYRDKAERIEQLAAWIAGEVLGKPEAAGAAATARTARESRSHHRHGLRVPRAAGDHGRHLRPGGRPARTGLEGDLSPVPAGRRRARCAPVARRISGRRLCRGPRFLSPTSSTPSPGCCMRGSGPPARGIRSDCAGRCTASCAS